MTNFNQLQIPVDPNVTSEDTPEDTLEAAFLRSLENGLDELATSHLRWRIHKWLRREAHPARATRFSIR